VDRGLADRWVSIREHLRENLGNAVFDSWISALHLGDYQGGTVVFTVPSAFIQDWISTHYLDYIQGLFSKEYPDFQKIVLNVGTFPVLDLPSESGDSREVQACELEGSPLDERFTFDSFVVGKPNELAHAAARRVAESEKAPFNPLFLYGGVGLGKTHLMHCIAHHIHNYQRGRMVMYLSAEKFMYQFIRALRYKDTVSFKEKFRSVDVLMIDDVQFISGKESTQEEFFHTFNALVDQNHLPINLQI